MRISVLFLLPIVIAAVNSLPARNISNTSNDEWASIPDVNGIFYRVNLRKLELEYAKSKKTDIKVTFRVVTHQSPGKGLRIFIGDIPSVQNSHFDPKNPTRILVHGWLGDKFSPINLALKEAYLKLGNYNVIVVDWSDGADTLNYFYARKSVDVAARKLGGLVDFLANQGTSLSSMYLIGHSLGAHLCGIAAKFIKTGRVDTIVGLEAALPLFSINDPDSRLDSTDADYVQTIHTNGGVLGFKEPLGHGSFYPNWGRTQPGCGFDLTGSCSHSRPVQYFAESLVARNNFVSYKCNSFEVIWNQKCATSQDEVALLGGDPINKDFQGLYYVPINSKQPYAAGKP